APRPGAGGGANRAASAQASAASAPGRPRAAPLAGLEPQRATTCLSAPRARPTGRGEPVAFRRFAARYGRDPLPRAARALASLVGRAARSQCARPNRESGDDPIVRHSSTLCHLARVGDGVTPP